MHSSYIEYHIVIQFIVDIYVLCTKKISQYCTISLLYKLELHVCKTSAIKGAHALIL